MGWFSKDKTDYNNDGQSDGSKGEDRSPPNSTPTHYIAEVLSRDIRESQQAERDAYNAGYDNASKKK